jgi:probable rRNA maturation factor
LRSPFLFVKIKHYSWMKINVEINSLVKTAADNKLIKKAAAEVVAGELGCASGSGEVEVSIALVGSAKIRAINKKYRQKDQVTDVLSFAEADVGADKGEHPRMLGELVICLKQVKDDAKEAKVSFKYELAWVVIHGVLHLLGYDHEKGEIGAVKMKQKEQFYLSKLKLV